MKRAASIQDAIQHTKGGYDVVPANIMLAGAEQELSQTGKEHRLKEAVAPVAANYNFIVIDTPPSLGVLTVNAFTCATDILIPTTAGIFATDGIRICAYLQIEKNFQPGATFGTAKLYL